ncbi:hypothetical protein K501DRAFT_226807 [Backusella circina FSU 941]|nr:hypothetical protein K501DRAFT_226807 [Backusella circina FSU 941]
MTYIYSLVAIAIFAQGLYALHKDSVRIFRWYTMFFWFDCFISVISTIWFAVAWYVYTDHSLPEIENDPVRKAEYDRLFDMEKRVSIAFLVILRLVHFYFALVVTRYYKSLNKVSGYSKLNESIDLEDAMSGRPAEYVPKQALD